MRAYAKKIRVPQSAVSEIIAGKRPVTKKTARKILTGLDRAPHEIAAIVDSSPVAHNDQVYKTLDIDTFHMISDWYYYAILSLAETDDFRGSPKWIAKRLGITEKVAREAIERLLRLDLLKESNSELRPTGHQFETNSELATPALRKANRQNVELIGDALELIPVAERDFTAMTLCFDPERIEEARKLIKNFRRGFARVMESKRKKEVYKICIQLFPLTRRK